MPYLTDPDRLAELLPGEPPYRTGQLSRWLYRTPVLDPAEMSDLPAAVRRRLDGRLWPFTVETELSGDGATTRKWLMRAPDGASIEAVLMGYPRRTTVCISSQAGCALGCTFCATGQFGFERHLEAGEMVAQVAYAEAALRSSPLPGSPRHVGNIVFMGMGEPLANYRRVREALRRMIEVMGRSPRSITVSTVGVVPGMRRLADEPWPVNLAVSLHAADDELRNRLVPINERYPLRHVIDAAARHYEATGRRPSLEWALIAGVNDGEDQAEGLAAIARHLGAHVNVIPLNPTPLTDYRPPEAARVQSFVSSLRRRGVNVTERDTRGRDIEAACGQLRVRAAEATGSPIG